MATITVGAGTGYDYATIQEAIDAANSGDIIQVANGTYTLTSTLNVNEQVSIVGESESGVIIDATAIDGYGILVTADGASLSDLTLHGPQGGSPSGNYGIKIQPDSGDPNDTIQNISLAHITVIGSSLSEIDLNGVVGATLTDITADGNGTGGVGIAITDSANITLTDITTADNAWGSVALYPTNTYYNQTLTNIVFAGTYSHNEPIGIYAEDVSNTTDLGTVTFPPSYTNDGDGVWKVTNDAYRGTGSGNFTFFFANETDAKAFALALQDDGAGPITENTRSVITGPDGHLHVYAGMSIQAAIDAATAGDTIVVGAGTYVENVQFNEAVTVLGAMAGVAGTGVSRDAAGGIGETTIIGRSDITAAGAVTIDGIRFVNNGSTTGGGASDPTLQIASGYNHTIENSIFWSEVAGGANGVDDRAISIITLATGSITISDNLVSGSSAGAYGTASWGRGLWFDGAGDHLSVTGNTFQYTRTGINIDMTGASTANIANNTFNTAGSGVSVGVDLDGVTFAGNTFTGVDSDFNLRNLADASVDLSGAVSSVEANGYVAILGGNGADTITGTAQNDYIDGNNLNATATDADILSGGGGDDILLGKGGVDTIYISGDTLAATVSTIADADPVTGGDQAGWQIVSADGTDLLNGVEIIVGDTGPRILLVGNGGFATIQAAVDAANAGDIVRIAAGTYAEDVVVDNAITLTGATGLAADVSVGSITIDGINAPAGTVSISAMTFATAQSASDVNAIRYNGSYDGTANPLGAIVIDNVVASGYDQNGIC